MSRKGRSCTINISDDLTKVNFGEKKVTGEMTQRKRCPDKFEEFLDWMKCLWIISKHRSRKQKNRKSTKEIKKIQDNLGIYGDFLEVDRF